jgi:hypothetical protein
VALPSGLTDGSFPLGNTIGEDGHEAGG